MSERTEGQNICWDTPPLPGLEATSADSCTPSSESKPSPPICGDNEVAYDSSRALRALRHGSGQAAPPTSATTALGRELQDLSAQPMDMSDPTKVKGRLTQLGALYRKSLANNPILARQSRLMAARYIEQAKKAGIANEFLRDLAQPLGIHLPIVKGIRVSIGNIFGNYAPGKAVQKIVANVGMSDAEHDPVVTDSRVTLGRSQELAAGLSRQPIHLDHRNYDGPIGEIITVSPSSQARAHYTVHKTSHAKAAQRGYALFTSANYSIDETRPATATIVDGTAHNLYVAPHVDGIVTIKNGQLAIRNAQETDIYAAMEEGLKSGGTLFQSNLLVHHGRNIVPQEGASKDYDVRRVLVTFGDGRYGMIQINEYLNLYELGEVLRKIPGIQSAVNVDTGGSNVAGYRDLDGHYTNLGETDDLGDPVTTATVFYIE